MQVIKVSNYLIEVVVLILFVVNIKLSLAHQEHLVGDSIWSIPPSNDFYSKWANNKLFLVGDSLVFRFEMGFYDLVQVARREFNDCIADNPFRSFDGGPVTVSLNEEGMNYFICSYGNYCLLGLKAAVLVHRLPPPPSPPPSPPPISPPTPLPPP